MNTVEGKKEKAAHLDWHFIVNQRLVETEKRGQSRSWYVDEEVISPQLIHPLHILLTLFLRNG
jgi:hypothetical protein